MFEPIKKQFQDHFYGAIWLPVEDDIVLSEQAGCSPTVEPATPGALPTTDREPDQP